MLSKLSGKGKKDSGLALNVRVVSAKDLKSGLIDKSDPFVLLTLGKDKKKTKIIKNTTCPIWNQEFRFVPVQVDQVLQLQVLDKDVFSSDKLGKVSIKLSELTVGQILEKNYKLGDSKEGEITLVLHLADAKDTPFGASVKVETSSKSGKDKSSSSSSSSSSSDVIPITLGSYSSSYSTSFTGYSRCSVTLSDISTGEEKYEIKVVKKKVYKPKPKEEKLKGVILQCNGLIKSDSDGSDTYVTIQLFSKSMNPKSEIIKTKTIHDTQDPVYEHEFAFDKVKKGQYLQIIVYQDHKILKDVPIAEAQVPLKQIEEGSSEKEIKLEKPRKLPKELKALVGDNFGTIKLKFEHERKF
ncbi:XYPPX repeat family protein [Histomonas meleagridis]|uniref:XYPPX repeat family protein n=1 Tax=Histomonas meleagridis TaxID=135588 RepID=UPI00355A9DC5|nr:XYPPX repeat family protein [Histomonas meleagridis]KAH0799777.1 XYPPX repeat family protein [Histomonas meleagridis]